MFLSLRVFVCTKHAGVSPDFRYFFWLTAAVSMAVNRDAQPMEKLGAR